MNQDGIEDMGRLDARLRRIEGEAARAAQHLVTGYSDAEHRAKIAELIRSGKAKATDMFVCIMRYGEPEPETASEPRAHREISPARSCPGFRLNADDIGAL